MLSNNFSLTTLSDNPDYFEEVIKLIEEEFHYDKNHSYEKDFAPLVHPHNFENCFLYIDNKTNSVIAHLAVCPRTLIKNKHELPILLIGGIATHKDYRGKLLFRSLMEHALEQYKSKAGLFILWSDLENLYEKFAFYRSGGLLESGKVNFNLDQRPPGYEKTTFNNLSDGDFNSIINLYTSFNENYFFTLKREEKEWSIIREMSSIDLYLKRNPNGEVYKYFCANKGHDLTNIIHEVSALNHSEYEKLLKEIEKFKTWLPETELNKAHNSEIFYTAFMKTGSLKLLNDFTMAISNNELEVASETSELIFFNYQNKKYEASHKEFLQYLFGPRPLEEFSSLGLSLYISGTDSI